MPVNVGKIIYSYPIFKIALFNDLVSIINNHDIFNAVWIFLKNSAY